MQLRVKVLANFTELLLVLWKRFEKVLSGQNNFYENKYHKRRILNDPAGIGVQIKAVQNHRWTVEQLV